MPNALEAAVARLERALQAGLNVDLHEFDDPDQADAHAKQLETDQKAQDKQNEKTAKELEGTTA